MLCEHLPTSKCPTKEGASRNLSLEAENLNVQHFGEQLNGGP
jgi:hypothetical protein